MRDEERDNFDEQFAEEVELRRRIDPDYQGEEPTSHVEVVKSGETLEVEYRVSGDPPVIEMIDPMPQGPELLEVTDLEPLDEKAEHFYAGVHAAIAGDRKPGPENPLGLGDLPDPDDEEAVAAHELKLERLLEAASTARAAIDERAPLLEEQILEKPRNLPPLPHGWDTIPEELEMGRMR